jgi:hypothetical protein
MTKKVRSMKGDMVDFDLFKIKEQMAKKNKSEEAKAREQFVYSKRRRGSKKTIDTMQREQQERKAAKTAAEQKVKVESETKAEKAKEVAPIPKSKTKRRIVKKNKA